VVAAIERWRLAAVVAEAQAGTFPSKAAMRRKRIKADINDLLPNVRF
jgi:hypothetical protein